MNSLLAHYVVLGPRKCHQISREVIDGTGFFKERLTALTKNKERALEGEVQDVNFLINCHIWDATTGRRFCLFTANGMGLDFPRSPFACLMLDLVLVVLGVCWGWDCQLCHKNSLNGDDPLSLKVYQVALLDCNKANLTRMKNHSKS